MKTNKDLNEKFTEDLIYSVLQYDVLKKSIAEFRMSNDIKKLISSLDGENTFLKLLEVDGDRATKYIDTEIHAHFTKLQFKIADILLLYEIGLGKIVDNQVTLKRLEYSTSFIYNNTDNNILNIYYEVTINTTKEDNSIKHTVIIPLPWDDKTLETMKKIILESETEGEMLS